MGQGKRDPDGTDRDDGDVQEAVEDAIEFFSPDDVQRPEDEAAVRFPPDETKHDEDPLS